MTIFKKLSVLLALLFTTVALLFFYFQQEAVVEPQPVNNALMVAINKCDGITERAAAHLVAVVEFQKLEIAGRKARVFKQCMGDHAYVENKQWLTISTPVAEKAVKNTNTSFNEALENMRRADMAKVSGQNGRPVYWVLRQVVTP